MSAEALAKEEAGIQTVKLGKNWIPVFTGMTLGYPPLCSQREWGGAGGGVAKLPRQTLSATPSRKGNGWPLIFVIPSLFRYVLVAQLDRALEPDLKGARVAPSVRASRA